MTSIFVRIATVVMWMKMGVDDDSECDSDHGYDDDHPYDDDDCF